MKPDRSSTPSTLTDAHTVRMIICLAVAMAVLVLLATLYLAHAGLKDLALIGMTSVVCTSPNLFALLGRTRSEDKSEPQQVEVANTKKNPVPTDPTDPTEIPTEIPNEVPANVIP